MGFFSLLFCFGLREGNSELLASDRAAQRLLAEPVQAAACRVGVTELWEIEGLLVAAAASRGVNEADGGMLFFESV